jgi:hypothetical protein
MATINNKRLKIKKKKESEVQQKQPLSESHIINKIQVEQY